MKNHATGEETEMTPEQIENWRKFLSPRIGSHALTMPERDIITLRDKIQAEVNELCTGGHTAESE